MREEENEKEGTSVSERRREKSIEEDVDILIPRRVGDRDEYVEFVSRYDDACRNFHTLAKDKEGHIVDNCSTTGHEINEELRRYRKVAANERTMFYND